MAQPKMGVIRYLLGRTFYPDNDWTRSRDGSPLSPYDLATDTMFEFMGVRVDPLDEAVPLAGLTKVSAPLEPAGNVARGSAGYIFDGRLNESFRALNQLLSQGVKVRRVASAQAGLRPGDFVVSDAPQDLLAAVARRTGVDFRPLKQSVDAPEVRRLRVGVYQHYRGGSTDEGWTRWLLEQFRFPYASLLDAELKKGKLNEKFDVIILPEDSTATLVGGRGAEETIPPEYRSGLGREGTDALKAFVEKGGTLVTLGGAGNFAIEKLGLHVRNLTAGKTAAQFWCPGSTLKVKFDTAHPLAYGMPPEGLVVFMHGSPAFEIAPSEHSERYLVVARYADRDLLASGWLIGEETVARKPAMVSAQLGRGRVVLIGFRAQHRAQTHGTFKLLFNALIP